MKRAYLGAVVCIAWAVLTAWAYLRREVSAAWAEDDDGWGIGV